MTFDGWKIMTNFHSVTNVYSKGNVNFNVKVEHQFALLFQGHGTCYTMNLGDISTLKTLNFTFTFTES